MDLLTLSQMRDPDPRTLTFGPLGISASGRLSPEDALGFEQNSISSANLASNVPDGVHLSFERLRLLHTYGLLCYDLFTVVDDLSWVVLEQALRERFIEFYDGRIPLTNKSGESTLKVGGFSEFNEAFRRGGTYAKGGWMLRPRSGLPIINVPLTLGPLLRWARTEGLLHGQRNRVRESGLLEEIRNSFAHGDGFKIVSPGHSSSAIHEVAELINKLWGHLTTGGRLYPSPLRREAMIVGWCDDAIGPKLVTMRPESLTTFDEPGLWTFIVVRGDPYDDLMSFDTEFERTRHPADLLWGPGNAHDTASWLASAKPEGDTVEHLDRLFAVRVHDRKVYLPRRIDLVESLPSEGREGVWHVVRADQPTDALGHVRHLTSGIECRPAQSTRGGCAAEDVSCGSYESIFEWLRTYLPDLEVHPYNNVAVPPRWSYIDAVDV